MALSTLQRRIRKLRVDRGLTQEQLADKCGLTDKSTISHWEVGDTSPRPGLIPKLAKALGVTVGDLYGEAA